MLEYNQDSHEFKLNSAQKWSVAGLSFLALLVVVFWAVQFKNSLDIYQTGEKKTADLESKSASCAGGSCLTGDQSLKLKDTDKDGLTDWDELNVYQTSPYLEDSDGDGIKDGVEIKNGTNPNCPEGKICGSEISSPQNNFNNKTSSSSSSSLGNLSPDSGKFSSDQDLAKILGGASNPEELRQLLLNSGMDEQDLNKISDEDLMKSYNETLKNFNSQQK